MDYFRYTRLSGYAIPGRFPMKEAGTSSAILRATSMGIPRATTSRGNQRFTEASVGPRMTAFLGAFSARPAG